MVILYLHQYFNSPSMNGSTRSYEMAKRMVSKGHTVHMITSRRDADTNTNGGWSVEDIDGIIVHWLAVPYNNNMKYYARIKAFFSFAFRAGNRAVGLGGDVIFATSTPLTIAIPAVRAKRTLKIPLIFEVRDLWPELPIAIGALKSPLSKWLARKLERFAYWNSEHIVCLSPGMQDGVVNAGIDRSKTTVIPNSCDLDLFNPTLNIGNEFRRKRAWLNDNPLVLYAGTLGHINGVGWLVEVAQEMLGVDSSVRFLIVGDGAEFVKIKQEAQALGVLNVNFYMEPAIPKEQMPEVLAAATVATSLFIPLKEMWANSANKFFDALASAKPIVINYEGWQAKIVRDKSLGVVLPSLNPHEAAISLSKLLQNEERLKACGQNSRNLAEVSFSRDILARQLITLIEDEYSNFFSEKQRVDIL